MRLTTLSLLLFIASLPVLVSPTRVEARRARQHMLPNAKAVPGFTGSSACITCHTDPAGDSPRNKFGQDVESIVNGSSSTTIPFWGAALAHMDSDGDGYTNGEELQDPDGVLLQEMFSLPLDQPFPKLVPTPSLDQLLVGNPSLVSNPGDPNSTPPPTPTPTTGGPATTSTPTDSPPTSSTQTPTASPTSTTTSSGTPTSTSAPTTTHTPANSVTPTSTLAGPIDTPTPTLTNSSSGSPTPATGVMKFNRDQNLKIDSRDVVILMHEGLSAENWFMMSVYWESTQP